MGLGIYPEVGITDARKAAASARELIRDGQDPIEARRTGRESRLQDTEALTFEQAARQVFEDLKPGWKNQRHTGSWISSLEMYVFPRIGTRKIKDLKAQDFADTLRRMWMDKPETASRVKQRCDVVMDWCVAQDLIGANPVGVVAKLLPKQPSKRERVQHLPAMPWGNVPGFIDGVLRKGKGSLSKAMLEFLILTAAVGRGPGHEVG